MIAPPVTLAFLAYHWGDAYTFSYVKDRWVALRRDARYFLTAETLAGLETVIWADYGPNPVSRDYDPPRAASHLDPALPDIAAQPGEGYADDDKGLNADALIVADELRRAFPLWTIMYSAQTSTWIGRTRSKTISQNSALSLAIALTLIQRRETQLARDLSQVWPPRDDRMPL